MIMKRMDTPCGRMSLLAWIPVLFFGMLAFPMLYGLTTTVSLINQPQALKIICELFGGMFLLAVYILWVRLIEGRPVSELGPGAVHPSLGLGLLVGFVLFCSITLVLFLSDHYEADEISADIPALIESFAFFFIVAAGEEVIFRGILFRMIDERFNTWVALLVSALVFGFVHLGNPGATVWSSSAIAIEAGIMLGLAYKCSGNLWFPIGIHWAWNFTQGNIFGFEVSGTEVSTSLIESTVSGPEFITGGSFGPEASILAAGFGLLISLYFFRLLKSQNGR